jgi:hypothetical protein
LKKSVARIFAWNAESDELHQVILQITFENKEGKYYICLDKPEFTVYLEEKEVLLQAGLKAKVESFEVTDEG